MGWVWEGWGGLVCELLGRVGRWGAGCEGMVGMWVGGVGWVWVDWVSGARARSDAATGTPRKCCLSGRMSVDFEDVCVSKS